jgi:hypothetical protein
MAFERTDVSNEPITSIISLTRLGELGTTLALVASYLPILITLMMEAIRPSETSVLTRSTQRLISEDGIQVSLAVDVYRHWIPPNGFIVQMLFEMRNIS